MGYRIRSRVWPQFWGKARVRAVCFAILAASMLYFLHLLIGERAEFNDFRYIWLAGRLWGQGIDPYTPAYIDVSHTLLPRSATNPWFYPFQWYGLTVPFGWLPVQPAMYAFMILSVAAMIGAVALLHHAAACVVPRMPAAVCALLSAYCLTSTIWDAAFRARQPVIFAALGIPLLIGGLLRSNRPLGVFGLLLVLTKPQIGLPIWIAVALLEGWFIPACIAAIATVLLSIPALVIGGGLGTILRFLHGTANYQSGSYNQAESMAGIPQIIYLATRHNLPLGISSAMGMAAGLLCGLFLRWTGRDDPESTAIRFAFLLPPAIACFVSLHPYDLIILAFALPFLILLPVRALVASAIGYVLLWRPENLVMLLHGTHERTQTPALAMLGILFLVIGTILAWPALAPCRRALGDLTDENPLIPHPS